MEKKAFSPLVFLASLGAGGIAVIPFSFLQYTFHTGKGLITFSHINHDLLPMMQQLLFYSLYAVMIIFTLIHLVMTVQNFKGLIQWVKTDEYNKFIEDPLKNAGILAPFISITMTMNLFIGPIRFFVPWMASNLQLMMLPALLTLAIIWVLLLRTEIRLLKLSFTKSFDVNKISFGWLLHPFALGMVTVTLSGVAAMSKNADIAHTAAAMTMISGSMAFFLLIVKMVSVFQSHFAAPGLPEKQFLPSFLIAIPNITLLAIAGFRLSHYLHVQFNFHTEILSFAIITFSFAFQTWYLMFGLALLKDYFKKHFFKKEFYVSQWGLICPFVAYAVLGSFVYKVFVPSSIVYSIVLLSTVTAITLFFILLKRHIQCKLSTNASTARVACQ
ncbi:MAG: hypothetical protein HOD92_07825, partial [Deltaproteobacteria bacterium]|nr:hypothetical protein [Deltaproteobacteria bacterium]